MTLIAIDMPPLPVFDVPEEVKTALAFLKLISPAAGPKYCVSAIGHATNNRWRDYPVVSHEELVYQSLANSRSGSNTYFALSSFSQGWHSDPKRPNKNVFRTQPNSLNQKCFWLDIDAGFKKGKQRDYPDAETAMRAVIDFLKSSGLPCPIIVISGLGLHLYWALNEELTTEQWRPFAHCLQKATLLHGLKVDTSRTQDSASVLRLPGTMNYGEDGVARPVYIGTPEGTPAFRAHDTLELCRKLIAAAGPAPLADFNQPPVAQKALIVDTPDEVVSAFSHMMQPEEDELRIADNIIRDCAQIRSCGTGTYTQWYNAMLVLKHCVDGEAIVHQLSATDPVRYDPQTTQNKYNEAKEGGCGPCRCDTFDEKDPNICSGCPFKGKITTPLQIGEKQRNVAPLLMPIADITSEGCVHAVTMDAPVMEVIPYSSKDFSVVPGQGIIYHKREQVTDGGGEDEDGKFIVRDILICDVELYIHSLYIDNTGRDPMRRYVIRKKPQERAAEDILFDIETAFGTQQTPRWLAQCGILPKKVEYNKLMGAFMQAYLASVQNRLTEIITREHFGWVHNHDKVRDENYDGFIVGDKMYSERGTSPVVLADRASDLSAPFHKRGSLDEWKTVPNMYKILNQPFGQLMMCAAFSTPLMKYGSGTATNVSYNIWDTRGGKGKSNLLKAVASVWGDPEQQLMMKNDTHAARFQYFSTYKNLPILIDELTTMDAESAANLMYDVVHGREKRRSTSSGTGLATSGTWSTVAICSSNRSLYEVLRGYNSQSDAPCMRVIDWNCDFLDYSGTPYAEYINTITNGMRSHYGHAGPAFLEYCFANPSVFNDVQQYAQNFEAKYRLHSDERFWMYGLAIALFAGRKAVEAGLLSYDMDALEGWVVNVLLAQMRATVKTDKPTAHNLIAEYLNENLNATLMVASHNRGPGQEDKGFETTADAYVLHYPKGSLFIRFEKDTGTYYISTRNLSDWCRAKGYSLTTILSLLRERGMLPDNERVQISLAKGVSCLGTQRSMAYKIVMGQKNAGG